jgi:hypothetical protein
MAAWLIKRCDRVSYLIYAQRYVSARGLPALLRGVSSTGIPPILVEETRIFGRHILLTRAPDEPGQRVQGALGQR